MVKTKRISKAPEVVPVLMMVRWGVYTKPGRCADCLKEIPGSSFGWIQPESDLRYHYDCKPKGKWREKL